MPRVKVQLIDLYCSDTEDVTGADTVYLTGGVTDGSTAKAVLTRPMRINDGETKTFGNLTLYEGLLARGSKLGVTLTAYDEDAAKDWNKHADFVKKLQSAIDSADAVTLGLDMGLLTIASLGLRAATWLAKADKDDRLGTDTRTITLMPGNQVIQVSFAGHPVYYWSDWRYRLRYLVSVNPGYSLVNQRSGKVLDVAKASKEAGARLIQWPPHGGDNQGFMLVGSDEPLVDQLVAVHSGMCLEAEGGGSASGTRVVQAPPRGAMRGGGGHWTSPQKWQITLGSNPLVRVVSKASGKALAVAGHSAKDGAEVVLADTADDPSQWWSSPQLWGVINSRRKLHR